MTNKRILLVEDEPHLAFTLKLNLVAEGYDVVHASTGPEAVDFFNTRGPYDVIILDVMLPELDGFGVAREIRKSSVRTGILMLTARSGEDDRLKGFDVGADDYIAKPFHLKELIARVRRMSERSQLFSRDLGQEDKIRFASFELDMNALTLTRGGTSTEITKLEASLLKELVQQSGRVVSREHLLATVWGVSSGVETRTVDNFVVRLRKLIEEDPKNPRILVSIRSKGYRFSADGNEG